MITGSDQPWWSHFTPEELGFIGYGAGFYDGVRGLIDPPEEGSSFDHVDVLTGYKDGFANGFRLAHPDLDLPQ